jgi:hypothetical protein
MHSERSLLRILVAQIARCLRLQRAHDVHMNQLPPCDIEAL